MEYCSRRSLQKCTAQVRHYLYPIEVFQLITDFGREGEMICSPVKRSAILIGPKLQRFQSNIEGFARRAEVSGLLLFNRRHET